MFYIFSCCYNSRTIQYIKFKFKALLSYTKATKYVKFQDVWCTGVRVGVFRISPIAFQFQTFYALLTLNLLFGCLEQLPKTIGLEKKKKKR